MTLSISSHSINQLTGPNSVNNSECFFFSVRTLTPAETESETSATLHEFPAVAPEPDPADDPGPGNGPFTICACADDGTDQTDQRATKLAKDKEAAVAPSKTPRPKLSHRRSRLVAGGRRRRLKFTAKRLGEVAEAIFLAKAVNLGFTVTKPWGDSEAYDFILDAHCGRLGLSRVQVKSAHRKSRDRGYSFSAHDFSLSAYSELDIDALVAYVVPEDAWYIIPIRDLGTTRGIHLFPSSKRRRSKYEKFREAWHYLEPETNM